MPRIGKLRNFSGLVEFLDDFYSVTFGKQDDAISVISLRKAQSSSASRTHQPELETCREAQIPVYSHIV